MEGRTLLAQVALSFVTGAASSLAVSSYLKLSIHARLRLVAWLSAGALIAVVGTQALRHARDAWLNQAPTALNVQMLARLDGAGREFRPEISAAPGDTVQLVLRITTVGPGDRMISLHASTCHHMPSTFAEALYW